MCFGRSVEASGPLSGGARTVRSVGGGAASVVEGQATKDQTAEMLQRALANMRSKARRYESYCKER